MIRSWGRTAPAALHRFSVGDLVSWMGPELAAAPSKRTVRVMRRLPPLGTMLQYRIKGDNEAQEHVVLEWALTPEPADNPFMAAPTN